MRCFLQTICPDKEICVWPIRSVWVSRSSISGDKVEFHSVLGGGWFETSEFPKNRALWTEGGTHATMPSEIPKNPNDHGNTNSPKGPFPAHHEDANGRCGSSQSNMLFLAP